jgi:hypothetical protein
VRILSHFWSKKMSHLCSRDHKGNTSWGTEKKIIFPKKYLPQNNILEPMPKVVLKKEATSFLQIFSIWWKRQIKSIKNALKCQSMNNHKLTWPAMVASPFALKYLFLLFLRFVCFRFVSLWFVCFFVLILTEGRKYRPNLFFVNFVTLQRYERHVMIYAFEK